MENVVFDFAPMAVAAATSIGITLLKIQIKGILIQNI